MNESSVLTTRAVIFDLYGTLIDLFSWDAAQKVLSDMAETLSLPIKSFQRLWTDTYSERVTGAFPDSESYMLDLCKRLRTVPCETSLEAAIDMMNEFTRSLMVPRPDAEQTLTRLKHAGLKLGLLTNCPWEVPTYWNQTSLAPLMDEAVFSFAVGCKKPDKRIYELTCDRLGVQPQESIFVGDGGNQELQGAEAVGMTSVLIRTPEDNIYNPRRTASDGWPGIRISRLSEIFDIALAK